MAMMEASMSHRFRAGQAVRLVRSSLRSAADGEFEIVRPLPDEGGETQYRIKSAREPHDRVVKESDLQIA
jgi:hypothetical protein